MYLYIGTNSHVAALDVKTGTEAWRTRLAKGGLSGVCVMEVDGRVFAGTAGYVYALDAQTGKLLWTNKLAGLGFHPVALASGGKCAQPLTDSGADTVTT